MAPPVVSDKTSHDGTRKLLFSVGNGNAIETVFIPEADRGTLCISSQAGCALDCAFCSTGKQGFNRNLTTAEIIGQLWMANKALGRDPKGDRIISNVVMMGMGEPLTNFDNVVAALKLMLDDNAYGLSRRRVTVSTSGIVPAMDRLRDACPGRAGRFAACAERRPCAIELVPINKKYPLKELLAACNRYLEKAPRDFITFEYVMLDGVNDSDTHARQLVEIASTGAMQVQPDSLQSFPCRTFQAQFVGSHSPLRRYSHERRYHHDHAQDAWRRYRRCLRATGRAGEG